MRVIHADLKTAQESASNTPYIYIYINSTDYSSRLLSLEHVEEPYRDRATIILDNSDRTLDPGTVDLRGKEFSIGYGYNTTSGNRYCGDGDGTDGTPTLWVKSQHISSLEGESVCVLSCEGVWMKLRELQYLVTATNVVTLTLLPSGYTNCVAGDIGKQVKDDGAEVGALLSYSNTDRRWTFVSENTVLSGSAMTITSGTGAGTASSDSEEQEHNAPYYPVAFGGTQTIREIITLILAEAGMSLNDTFGDDGIIDTLKPFFDIDVTSLPSLASILYSTDMLLATKCYLRSEASKVFKIIYPQSSDAVDETYYSDQAPYFKRYEEKLNLIVPNDIKVFWGADPGSGSWKEEPYKSNLDDPGSAVDQDSIDAYTTVRRIYFAPRLTTQTDGNNRASAILSRFQSEQLSGRLLLPYHDCSVELYDRVRIYDNRGSA